jgi:hypothetical protein
MILVASQRGGAGQLARHLLNDRDNDHVAVQELRGFLAGDLHGALAEAHAISKATRCKQFMFSLSLNPPKDSSATREDLVGAADRAEETLGLAGQPRALVIHEKNGRLHAHVVWSRIDAEAMKAVNLPYFKNRLKDLSKALYLEHGWELPEGHRENGWKNPLNFTLAEWQQAKRLGLDPREIKQLFQDAWRHSDGLKSFRAALEDRGFFLARGDRRGFVALDIHGEVFSVARATGIKTKELNGRLGDPASLPGVEEVRAATRKRMTKRLREHVREDRQAQAEELKPLAAERAALVKAHRVEREILQARQEQRWRAETKQRAERLHKGLRGAWEVLTGRAAAIRRRNEEEAYRGYLRDRDQREDLFNAQAPERTRLQQRIDAIDRDHRQKRLRLAGRIVEALRNTGDLARTRERTRLRAHDFDLEL